MRDLFVAAVVFGVLPFVLARPHIGLYLYSWISYMNPHRLAWGFAYDFPWAYITAVATLVGVLISKEPKRMPWSREMTVLVLLLSWMLVTTIFAFYPQLAWPQFEKVAKIQLMIFLTPLVINTPQRLRGLVWVIVLSLAFYGIKGGIFTIVHGGVYRVRGPEGSFIGGNNEIALALLMTIPLMRYLQLTEKNRFVRLGLWAGMILTGLAAIGSQSRGALVAAAVMATVFWLKSRHKIGTLVTLGVAVALVVLVMPPAWYERMQTIQTYEEDASALGRINAWRTAWNVAKSRITGGGFETFQAPTFHLYAPEPDRVHDAHSVYFEMLGEHGFPGLALWLLLGVFAWRSASRTIALARASPQWKWAADLAAMTQVALLAYYAGGAFLGLAYFDLYYHLLMIIVVARLMVEKEATVLRLKPNGRGRPAIVRAS